MKLISHYVQKTSENKSRITNWHDNLINNSLLYSYRDTAYSKSTYPSNMHYHDYYELVVLEEGDIIYVCGSSVYFPKHLYIVVIPPRKIHMSKINLESTRYKRHVFYFYPDAFGDELTVLTAFLKEAEEGLHLRISFLDAREECERLLGKLKKTLKENSSPLEKAIGYGVIVELFSLFNQKDICVKNEFQKLPNGILDIKSYLDENFAAISSVSEVAEHFFYSREYVSRLFKKYFDTTILDYIHKRRISESQALIASGVPIIEVCYKVGFGSLSSFIRVFKEITGMKPSEYRNLK